MVKTPAGFKEAYEQYCANGWNGLTKNPEYGGQGLPQLVATAVEEMWHAANLAFDLCPLLTQGAIEAIELRGTDRAQGNVPAEDGGRHVDRHDEPHRAAGRVRPRRRAHARGAAGRRHVQAVRPEDLHHLRRARLHREHHPPGAGAHAGCAGRREGHLAVRRAQVPGQRRWHARRAQRRALRVDRAQARHPREPDRRCWPTATRAARSATWSARRIAASSTCSS